MHSEPPNTNPDLKLAAQSVNRPLAGLRVLDMTTVMLGPYATQTLGDYGADVIKVESTEGDSTRHTGPALEPGMAATFIGANRNKRSIVLDLKRASGRQALLALARSADVLLRSIRPQKMTALGLSDEVLRAQNERLVIVGVHGFGEAGPYAGRPAYDDIIQGMCGLASLNEMMGQEPSYVPTVIADKTCALFAVQAVLLGLSGRATSGKGCTVEVPMFEAMTSFTLVEHFYGAHFRPPVGGMGYKRLLTPWRRPYRTLDGYVCIVPYSTRHWQDFFAEAGRADLLADARFSTIAARTSHIDELYRELGTALVERTSAQWLTACERLDIPAAPYRRLADLEQDPHLAATGFFESLQDGAMGEIRMTTPPLRFDGKKATVSMPPRLGEHTVQILREAGLAEDAIEELLASGAAVQHKAASVKGASLDPAQ
jgi:crotonobetainyl-CoA:carnitine CoA-transferase CaiB-like acyl-CoA transferase